MFICCADGRGEKDSLIVVTEGAPSIVPAEPGENLADEDADSRRAEDGYEKQQAEQLPSEQMEAERRRGGQEAAEDDAAVESAQAAQATDAHKTGEEAVAADEGLSLTFRDPSGARTYAVTFRTKPLGMDFNANVKPVKINKVFCAAKALGVQEGSELISVAGADVEEMDFVKILELLKAKVAPLRPDGLVIVFKSVGGQQKAVVFPTQPLGMDFAHNKTPIRIKLIFPGAAHSLGVEDNSEIVGVAGIGVEQMAYEKILELLRSKTSTLPLKE